MIVVKKKHIKDPKDSKKWKGWSMQERAIIYTAGFDFTAQSQADHVCQLQKQFKGRSLASIQTMLTKFRTKHNIIHNYGSVYPNFDQLNSLLETLDIEEGIPQWKESEDHVLKSVMELHTDAINYRFYQKQLKALLPGRKFQEIKKRAQIFITNSNTNKIWSEYELGILIGAVNKYGQNWGTISKFLVDKSTKECMEQYAKLTEEQDKYLKNCILDLDDKVGDIKKQLFFSSKNMKPSDFAHITDLSLEFQNKVSEALESMNSMQNLVTSDIKEFLNKCICEQNLKSIGMKLKKYIL